MRYMSKIPLPPAPGAAEHLGLALANSLVTLPGQELADELGTPEEATRWLIENELAPRDTALLPYCQNQLTALRANVRSLLAAQVAGRPPEQSALEAVNRALTGIASAPLLHYSEDRGLFRAAEHPVTQLVEHAMAQIAEDTAALLTSDHSATMAQCEAAPCDRFLIRSHARRRWCSTRCGDRIRAARAYARRQK